MMENLENNERDKRLGTVNRVGRGAHNRTHAQNVALGKKGGTTKTNRTQYKGFGSMDRDRLKEITRKGGKNRWQTKPIDETQA
jgi:general stress protein YciG